MLSDEIYERLTYSEENPHISIASLPGMKERTILLNGLSKSMAMTGWRLGYIAADEKLIDPLNRMCFLYDSRRHIFCSGGGRNSPVT